MDLAYDAIIVGAGPAGSVTAILLARSGWRVALIDRVEFPRRKVCGECIAASNMPLLAALGLGEALAGSCGFPLRDVALSFRDQTVRASLPTFNSARHPWGYAVAREVLDTVMVNQAKKMGATLFFPWSASDIRGVPGEMSCTIRNVHTRDMRQLDAPVLISASGSWEVAGAFPRFRSASDLLAFKANFESEVLEPGLLPVLSFPGGYGGMVVRGQAVTTLAFCMRRDTLAQCRRAMPGGKAAEAAAVHVRASCRDVDTMLGSGRQLGSWLSAGPLRPGIKISGRGQGAFLVGNAAGEAHPIIGEGLSMAIQSAWLLAHILLEQGAPALMSGRRQQIVQQGYAATWRRTFAFRVRLAALLAHAAMRPLLVAAFLPILQRHPSLLTYAARRSGKVDCIPCNGIARE
jgi:2-polyprenyl-6-methoxyphenol hydroxylase-like FAD-dependent oxidoreductase